MQGRCFNFFGCLNSSAQDDSIEQTFVIIRGDAIARNLLGQIIADLQQAPFNIAAMKTIKFNQAQVDKLYPGARQMHFYPNLLTYMTTGYHVALVLRGENAVARMLALKGKSPQNDQETTLRSKYGVSDLISSIHCSHTLADADREIRLFFKPSEINSETPIMEDYLAIVPNI